MTSRPASWNGNARADVSPPDTSWDAPSIVGLVLLADGFNSIDVDGRRLAIVGMVSTGVVTLLKDAKPLYAGSTDGCWAWSGWRQSGSGDIQYAALAGWPLVANHRLDHVMGEPPAIHFRDEQQERDLVAARSTTPTCRPNADPLVRGDRGDRVLSGWSEVTAAPIRAVRPTRACTLLAALLVMVIARHDPAVPWTCRRSWVGLAWSPWGVGRVTNGSTTIRRAGRDRPGSPSSSYRQRAGLHESNYINARRKPGS